jgi:glycosyltransferase involved in cell wall biosynthesis
MKALLRKLIGADRPKVIAVIGLTRSEVEVGIAHARTCGSDLPIRSWCAEDGATARKVRHHLQTVWPALTVVAWTGTKRHTGLKLLAFTVPPFRIVIFNEAHGFFAARPGRIAAHAIRRFRDATRNLLHLSGGWLYSIAYRSAQRLRDIANLSYALLLEALARIAPILPAPKLPVAQVTDLPSRPAPGEAGTTYTKLILSGRSWPQSKIKNVLSKSKADFLILQTQNETNDPQPLIEGALKVQAFATARQIAYTGWRAQLLNKHPFRRLQPGEIAQVSAPWSNQIAIRRDIFAQLRVPNATTTGAALMLLFWKAALAGWKSYAIGHGAPVTQEPAMPLEDREFALRVPPSPQPGERARGNVAFSPGHTRPFRGLPRILIVSPYLPFPLSHGGAVRIYNLCRALSTEFDFLLACFREANETVRYPELHEVFREVYAIDIDEKHSDPSVPKQVAEYRNSAMDHLIRTLCAEREISLVQLEYTQMAEYRNSTGQVPVLLVEHDITFTLYRQLNDPAAALWQDFERAALQCSNAVWTMSEHDRAIALENGASRRTTAVVPNGVDLQRFQPQPRQTTAPAVLFVGSFRHLPNLLAFEALRNIIMPAIWRDVPECRLHVIAGPDHERAAQLARKTSLLAEDPRISMQGFVEDVRPAYRECDVVAIPLPISAGTNIKLMEAMACGRAIVSTPVGCRGLELIDGEELLIREIGPAFAEALLKLLKDTEVRNAMAAIARRSAERRFSWDAIAKDALPSILSVARLPSHAASASGSHESRKFAGSASQNTSGSQVRQ